MRRRYLLFLSLLLCANARAMVQVSPLTEDAKRADIVVVAKAVQLRRIKVSESYSYELATFELVRIVASREELRTVNDPPDHLDDPPGTPRFCVFRMCRAPYATWKTQDLDVGTPYILALKSLGFYTDGCYGRTNDFRAIPKVSEAWLRKLRKALYGTEGERIAAEGMTLQAAMAHAAKAMDATEKSIQSFAEKSDKAILDYVDLTPWQKARAPDPVFRHLANDRRVLLVQVEGKAWRIGGPGRAYEGMPIDSYSPLIIDAEAGSVLRDLFQKDAPPAVEKLGCRFHTRDLGINAFDFEKALLAEREIETARGKVTVRMHLKTEPGVVGAVSGERTDQEGTKPGDE